MKQVSFGKFTVQLFLSSVFGVFVCACLDFWLGLEGDNLWSQLFMMFGYVFLYSLFPYYICYKQANNDRKILRYKEHYPEEVEYSLKSLNQPNKGLIAGLIVMVPHLLTTILPFFTFFGVEGDYHTLYRMLNSHLRELIDFAVPMGTNGTWLGMIFLIAYQFILPLVCHYAYYTVFKEIPVIHNIMYGKNKNSADKK
ncbi:MAG: hypothetical protein IKD34_02390 [Oscillospiraceae bacterium]|nr:hypothetical protein [Oscillospiraceae bacterium]MBQ7083425.1 hypothetical protein [Oscillospiraceae bacterium]MBR2635879.1 hypothetical protein [Oscillospiraceae bacterium]